MALDHLPSAESEADWTAAEQPSHHKHGFIEVSAEKLPNTHEIARLQVLLKLKASLFNFPSSGSLFIQYDSDIANNHLNGAITSATLLLLRAQIELFISAVSNSERDSINPKDTVRLNQLITELDEQYLGADAVERNVLSGIAMAIREFQSATEPRLE